MWIWTLRRTAGAISSCSRRVREHWIYGSSQASIGMCLYVCKWVCVFVCLFCSVELFCKTQQHVGVYRPSCQLHSQVYGNAWFKTPDSLQGGWRQWDDEEGSLNQMFAAVDCFECFFAEGRRCSEKRERLVCGSSQSRGAAFSCCKQMMSGVSVCCSLCPGRAGGDQAAPEEKGAIWWWCWVRWVVFRFHFCMIFMRFQLRSFREEHLFLNSVHTSGEESDLQN